MRLHPNLLAMHRNSVPLGFRSTRIRSHFHADGIGILDSASAGTTSSAIIDQPTVLQNKSDIPFVFFEDLCEGFHFLSYSLFTLNNPRIGESCGIFIFPISFLASVFGTKRGASGL